MRKYLPGKESAPSVFTHKYGAGQSSQGTKDSPLKSQRHQRILHEYYEHKKGNQGQQDGRSLPTETSDSAHEAMLPQVPSSKEMTGKLSPSDLSAGLITFGKAARPPPSFGENTIPNTERELSKGAGTQLNELQQVLKEVNLPTNASGL